MSVTVTGSRGSPTQRPSTQLTSHASQSKPSKVSGASAKDTFTPAAQAKLAKSLPKSSGSSDKSKKKPGFMDRLKSSGSALASGLGGSVVGIGKNLWESVTTLGGGIKKLFTGDAKGGLKDIGMSAVKVFQTPVDAVLYAGAKTVSAVQTLAGVEPVGRKLTSREIDELKTVFGKSVDYSKVVIKEGDSGVFSSEGRGLTIGNTIYIPKDLMPLEPGILAHEMTHVWQYQTGGTDYMSEALWGQMVGSGYDFEKGIGKGKPFRELNPEQQAELVEQAYEDGFFSSAVPSFNFEGQDYTAYTSKAAQELKIG